MVDDGVHVDVDLKERFLADFNLNHFGVEVVTGRVAQWLLYPDVVASGDHVSQFRLTTRSGAQVVADGLVSLPPGPPGGAEHDVLIWRGDLRDKQMMIGTS